MQTKLILINSLLEIEDYKKVGISNFLFALEDFSIGYTSFKLSDIPKDSYLFINRLLTSNDIDNIKKMKDELLSYKGIVFEDLGIYEIFKDSSIELILNQTHFQTNSLSVNFWLDRVTSVILPSEITKEEIDNILKKANGKVIINRFAKNMIMYSRRSLLTNYNTYQNLENKESAVLKENISNNEFLAKESKYGTVLFNNTYFNYTNIPFDNEKIMYDLYLNLDLSSKDIIDIINGKSYGDEGFLNKKTVYRLEDFKGAK